MTFPNPELYVQDSNGCCRLQSTSFDRKIFYWKNWTPCRKKSIDRHRLPVVRKDFNKSLRKPSSSHAQYVMGRIQTGFTRTARVTCSLSEHQLNVCIDGDAIKTFSGENFEDVQEILTHSRNEHFDVTVTVDEHLVYTDWEDGSINIMRGEKLERLVKLVDWKPQATCCTSSCELLVAIQLADRSQSKVVRYNDSRVIQETQYTDSRNLLYSNPAFIEENKNQTKTLWSAIGPNKQLSW